MEINNLIETITVMVFRTNIMFKKDLKNIRPLLNDEKSISSWNVDFDDPERILRLETIGSDSKTIINLINEAGFFCEELQD